MIPISVKLRIEEIQAMIREERSIAADLENKVTNLKSEVRKISLKLDDVDAQLLPSMLKEARSEHQWNLWLDNAARFLQIAVQHREYVAGLVAKFGLDAKVIP